MSRFKPISYLACCFYLLIAEPVYSKKVDFFSCQSGFQFETKKGAARCIKQQRLSYRAPEPCKMKGNFKLSVDKKKFKDLCVATALKIKSFSPVCPRGFKLQTKRGKDSCAKTQAEIIKPPSKKVKR